MTPLRRRLWAVALCSVLLVGGLSARVLAHTGRGSASARHASLAALHAFQPGLNADLAHVSAELRALARRASVLQAARAARERQISRTRFRGLSSQAAIALAERLFPGVVAANVWTGLRLPAGSRIERYLGSSEAVVRARQRHGRGSLVLSTGALVGRTPAGRRAPVDLELTLSHGAYVPRSSAAEMRLPRLASGPLKVGDAQSGFGVSLVGAASRTAVLEHGHLAYGNVYRSTDVFLQAVPSGDGGVELAYQLRSPSSPATLSLRLALGRGETLAVAKPVVGRDSAVVIERGKKVVGAVTPAIATDAQGRSLPVSLSAQGDRLALHVDTAGPVAWPVLVDPILETFGVSGGPSYGVSTTSPTCSFPGGLSYSCPPTPGYWGFYTVNINQLDGFAGSTYLELYGDSYSFTSGADAYFYLPAPNSNVYIYAVAQYAVSFSESPTSVYPAVIFNNGSIDYGAASQSPLPGTPQPGEALVTADGGQTYTTLNSGQAIYENATPESNESYLECAYVGGQTPCSSYQPGLMGGNEAAWALVPDVPQPSSAGVGYQNSAPVGVMGATAVFESQTLSPTMAVTHTTQPSSSTWVQSYSDQATLTGSDAGLGMGSVSLSGPGVPNGTTTDTSSGTGTFGNLVSSYTPRAISYTAPEGIDTYTANATDVAGNTATPTTWTVKVDHTPPVIGTLSGSLATAAAQSPPTFTLPVGQLTVPVTDAVSGVASIGASIDCPGVNLQGTSQSPSPGQGLTATITLNALSCSRGMHTITITATDAAGNQATRTITVDLEPAAGSASYYDYVSQQLDDKMTLTQNVGTGDLGLNAGDVSIAGTAGMDLGVDRTYNALAYPLLKSQAQEDAQDLSPGWSLSIGPDVHLDTTTATTDLPAGEVRYYDPSGATYLFIQNGATYQAPNLPATLVKNSNGTYTLTYYLTNTVYTFAGPVSNSAPAPLVSETDRNGNTITVNYVGGTCGTAVGCEISTIHGTQGQILTFSYNTTGQVTQITDSSNRTWKYGYDANGNLATYTDPTNAQTLYRYDPTTDLLTSVTDPNGNTTSIVYDSDRSHRVASVTEPDGTKAGQVTTFNYVSSTETDVTDPASDTTKYTLDGLGRVTLVQDPTGKYVAQTWNQNGTSATSADSFTGGTTSTTYETGSTNAYLAKAITEPNNATGSLTYNTPGQPYLPDTVTDAQGHTLSLGYNTSGDLQTVSGTVAGATQTPVNLRYNANGTISQSTDGANNVTTDQYNSLGQLVTVTPPTPLASTTLAYDSEGRIATVSQTNGHTTSFSYDGDDRVLTETTTDGNSSDTQTFTYKYDGNGNQLTMTGNNGVTTNVYDAANRLTSEAQPGSTSPALYAYDEDDDVTSVTDSLYDNETFRYDAAGRLQQVVFNGQPGQTYNYGYQYAVPNSSGTQVLQSETINFPNGIVETRTYTNGQVTEIKYAGAGGVLRDFKYGYNSTSSPSTPTDLIQQETDQSGNVTSYGYDTFNRLTGATVTNGSTPEHAYQYAYDGAGNRMNATIDGAQTSYAYNAANELQSATTAGQVARTFTYDSDGNQETDSTGYTASYNVLNQTTAFEEGLQLLNELTPTYDGPGQADRTSSSGAVTYANTGLGVTSSNDTVLLGTIGAPDNTSNGQTTYVRDPYGNLLGITTVVPLLKLGLPVGGTTTNYTYATDLYGSVSAIYDGSQTLQTAYTYDPYGNVVTNTPDNVTQPYRFQGAYQDSTGLYKMGERYYDPTTGRWTQPDPESQSLLADPTQANPYAFAGNDPANNTDATGTDTGATGLAVIHSRVEGCERLKNSRNKNPDTNPYYSYILTVREQCEQWSATWNGTNAGGGNGVSNCGIVGAIAFAAGWLAGPEEKIGLKVADEVRAAIGLGGSGSVFACISS